MIHNIKAIGCTGIPIFDHLGICTFVNKYIVQCKLDIILFALKLRSVAIGIPYEINRFIYKESRNIPICMFFMNDILQSCNNSFLTEKLVFNLKIPLTLYI